MKCKIKGCEKNTTRISFILCDGCAKTITTKNFIDLASDNKATQ